MHYLRRLVLIFALAVTLPAFAETLLIASGAGYKRPVAELAELFQKQTGIRVEQIYGHMGTVVAQARQSSDLAIILGDQAYLVGVEGLDFADFLPLGSGRLAVAWPNGSALSAPEDIRQPRFARIAIPNPKAAIYGIAASEYLEHSGLKPVVKDRLQEVATVPQVSAYLISGEVDAGFINLTEALAIRTKIGGYREIDARLYSPIKIVAGVLRSHAGDAAVQAFGRFMATPDAKAVLSRHGL